ncbi:SUR7 [Candida oxycetoniae]|uniref:SUR7 n=1 Tax=Candida oxycetoniae TaxID=497107 RepID=A0AAI9WXW8_9ASCO|nr:SUR7 [Candida oxycetoniae]KAI3404215.1 SUR7 [Candida oxycetoniae]
MKAVYTLINLFFLAGAILLLIFTVLSGSSAHSPIDKFYWLEADTSGLRNAPAERSAWTFWGVCDTADYTNCLLGPAYPISPVDNFDTTNNIPQEFIDKQDTFYYLSRFAFAFCLIALGLTGLAFIIDILGFCLSVIDKIVMVLSSAALFFMAAFASVQTAVVVMAKNAFSDDDRFAKVGAKSMGVMWAAFVCIVISWGLTFSANIVNSFNKFKQRREEAQQAHSFHEKSISDDSSLNDTKEVVDETNTGGIRFFNIKRNQKNVDDELA